MRRCFWIKSNLIGLPSRSCSAGNEFDLFLLFFSLIESSWLRCPRTHLERRWRRRGIRFVNLSRTNVCVAIWRRYNLCYQGVCESHWTWRRPNVIRGFSVLNKKTSGSITKIFWFINWVFIKSCVSETFFVEIWLNWSLSFVFCWFPSTRFWFFIAGLAITLNSLFSH